MGSPPLWTPSCRSRSEQGEGRALSWTRWLQESAVVPQLLREELLPLNPVRYVLGQGEQTCWGVWPPGRAWNQ